MTAPAVGWVTVSTVDPKLDVTARLADERPDVSSGFGGWDTVERPRRKPLTTWKSSPALVLTLPLLLDEWTSGVSIERSITDFETMGVPTAHGGEPPVITLAATGGAVPFQGRSWVLTDLAFGDALMNEDGDRVRQYLTLTLTEYVEDVQLVDRSAANRRRRAKLLKARQGAAAKRVLAKKSAKKLPKKKAHSRSVALDTGSDFGSGEDLLTIAARELGDADRWVEIAALNGLRDPRAIEPGQVIRLP